MDPLLLPFKDVFGGHDPIHFGVGLEFVEAVQHSAQQCAVLVSHGVRNCAPSAT